VRRAGIAFDEWRPSTSSCNHLRVASQEERARRKRLRDAYKNAERTARSVLMPLGADSLGDLVDFVDARVSAVGCDHTRQFTVQWAADHEVSWERLVEGLDEFGGYCDCEVVMNCGPDDVFG
jgi:hypothetical protein